MESPNLYALGEQKSGSTGFKDKSFLRSSRNGNCLPPQDEWLRETSLSPRPFLLSSSVTWVALDFALALTPAVLTQARHTKTPISLHVTSSLLLAALPFAFFVILASHLSGLYRMNAKPSTFLDLLSILRAVTMAGLGLYSLQKLWGAAAPSSGLIAGEAILTGTAMFAGRVLWRRRRRQLCQREITVRNFFVVGADEIGRDVRLYLTSLPYSGYRFQGFIAMCEPTDDELAINDEEIVGDIHDVIEIARSKFVDEIIFSRRPATPGILSLVLRQAQSLGIAVRLIPSITETLIDRTDVQYVGDLPTIAVFQPRRRRLSLSMKRVFDIVVAACASFALLPLLVVIAIVIKLQSSGPVFYPSKRVGHKGRVFTCYKFRTMVDNAAAMQEQLLHMNEREGVLFKITKDPRVTVVGAFLRKYSLDELPQLWNVIRGDMSLVGPRPSMSSEVAQYEAEHLRRLDAVPGITGLWQVEARRDPSFEKYITLDSKYVNHWSLGLDMRILLRTVTAVIRGTGS